MKSKRQFQIVRGFALFGRIIPLLILFLFIAVPSGNTFAAPDAAPGNFGKTSPTNGTPGRSSSLTLYWSSSSGATSYQYCYDTTPNGTCDGSWVNVGTNTSWGISGLSVGTIYYWQVQAVNVDGTTQADGGNWWNFSTSPGNFNKTSPADLATGQVTTGLQLEWTASTGAETYEYCISTSPSCTVWTEVGNTLTTTANGLTPGTTYFWQVRADLGGGTTEANTGSWYRFYTQPGPFGKASPVDGATGQSSITLSWSASTGAAGYYYCFDTSDNDTCNTSWTSAGSTSAAITTNPGTTYYWHVRSVYQGGYTYSDSDTWWSFSTAPANFGKNSPSNGATGVLINPTLIWGTSTGASAFEYCYDLTNDSTCNGIGTWTNRALNTSVALSGLTPGTTYYWQVRSLFNGGYTYADTGTWYSFTTLPLPAAFNKANPPNLSVERPLSFTISWNSSTYASSYQYCYDTVNDSVCAGSWTSTGSTSASIGGLSNGTTYYWQVQAVNASGTTDANGGTWWSFSTAPGAFGKTTPTHNTAGLATSFNLIWGASSGATSYEYCYDTIGNTTCDGDGAWTGAGSTSVTISGLDHGETYYWQVRAVFNGGYTYANSGTWWTFHTAPGAFTKTNPVNLATGQLTNGLQLQWDASSGATSYEFCYSSSGASCPGSWTSVSGNTTVTLGSLTPGTIYYWQVRAVYASGYTYANNSTWWSYYTAPAAFSKTSPTNGASGQATSFNLTWAASTGASSYEYCYDTINDSTCNGAGTWTSTASTGASISGLTAGSTYYWQVRAVYQGGYTDANSGSWWTFSTVPGSFNKTSPTNLINAQPTSLTLQWEASLNATSYEYCFDTSDDDNCSGWTSIGSNTSVGISGLTPGAYYYWHVRALYNGGTTYANGSSTAFWTFITAPGSFNKSSPANGLTGQSSTVTLSWGPSQGADTYRYCYDTSDDGNCINWVSNGTNTSIGLSSLVPGTTYYWQVKASFVGGDTFANGSETSFWNFSTAPGALNKTLPGNGATGQVTPLNLLWGSSQNASSYEYCINTSASCPGPWTSRGTNLSVDLSSLTPGTTYYWQVRAVFNGGYTYANSGSWWVFHTAPGAFGRTSPANGASGQTTSLNLTWEPSQNATSYEYCYDTSHDIYCTSWIPTGGTSVALGGLTPGTTYSWHVRALYAGGYQYADGVDTTFWSFSTAPGAFNKTSPSNGTDSLPTNPTLSWNPSSGATSYQFCYDTSDDDDCDGSWNPTTNTSVGLGGLTPGDFYYWQIKAVFSGGTTEADGGTWFSFSVAPGSFIKIDPGNGSTGQNTSLAIFWTSSQNATSYEYCYDDTPNNVCDDTWIDAGMNTNAGVSGLDYETQYEWQVRAVNTGGIAYANDGSWWTFTTQVPPPEVFSKITPVHEATDQPTELQLLWEASTNATLYEYCIDDAVNSDCDTSWIDASTRLDTYISSMIPNTQYEWQVRASNTTDMVYANTGTWFTFTTRAAPADFDKLAPVDTEMDVPINLTLTWEEAATAFSYAYCIDTTDDDICDDGAWITLGNDPWVSPPNLKYGVSYYWHVKAVNASGTTYSNGDTWWSFTTMEGLQRYLPFLMR